MKPMLLEFQKQNNIGFIQEEGNSAAGYLVRLNREYAGLKTQYELLTLLDLDQNLDRAQSNKGDAPSGTENNEDKGLPFSDVGPARLLSTPGWMESPADHGRHH